MKKKSSIKNPLTKHRKLVKISSSRPTILNLSRKSDITKLEKLLKGGEVRHIRDQYKQQLEELFAINNPPLVFTSHFKKDFESYYKQLVADVPEWQQGRWVFFPWISTLVHILEDENFQRVRTARNRNLITEEEQKKFYDATVGIAGLSIGNSAALAIALQGGARKMKLADFDTFDLSNLNRIRAGVTELGLRKTDMTARQIYEINPYATVEICKDGLTENNIEGFFRGLNVVVDEIDNLATKYLIRKYAHRFNIPVVMAIDNGENSIIDVERYDLPDKPSFFHGRLGRIKMDQLQSLNKREIGLMIVKHIGPENLPPRVWSSFEEMGKTLPSWPQLGGVALLNGSAVAYAIRKIATGQSVVSDRAIINIDTILDPLSPPVAPKRDPTCNEYE